MKNIEKIIGKKAHWGTHTFEASKDFIDGKECVRIDIFRNVPRIFEASFFFESVKQMVETSIDETSAFIFYTGRLNGTDSKTVYADKKTKTGRTVNKRQTIFIPRIESFIGCFTWSL